MCSNTRPIRGLHFGSLTKYVKPGGLLVVDVYRRDLAALLQWKYLLRPITRRMPKETLYRLIATITPPLVPVAKRLRRIAGRMGARLVPIVEYSHLGLPPSAECAVGRPRHIRHVFAGPRSPSVPGHRKSLVPGC